MKVVDELIDRMLDAKNDFDIVREFATPIPVRIISDILGVPKSDYSEFQQRTVNLARSFDVTQTDEVKTRGMRAHLQMVRYFEVLVEERRTSQAENLIQLVTRAEDQGDTRSAGDVVIAMCILMNIGGYETTLSLISNGIRLLLQDDTQRSLLQSDSTLARKAREELARLSRQSSGLATSHGTRRTLAAS